MLRKKLQNKYENSLIIFSDKKYKSENEIAFSNICNDLDFYKRAHVLGFDISKDRDFINSSSKAFNYGELLEDYKSYTNQMRVLLDKLENQEEAAIALKIFKCVGINVIFIENSNIFKFNKNIFEINEFNNNVLNIKFAIDAVSKIKYNQGFQEGQEDKIEQFKNLFNIN